jgi:hypothetical protein
MIALLGLGLVVAAIVARALRKLGRRQGQRRRHWRRVARHAAWRYHRSRFPRWYAARVHRKWGRR